MTSNRETDDCNHRNANTSNNAVYIVIISRACIKPVTTRAIETRAETGIANGITHKNNGTEDRKMHHSAGSNSQHLRDSKCQQRPHGSIRR